MRAIMSSTSIQLKNILIATDFSPAAHNAMVWARVLAAQWGAHLHVVHVLRPESWEFASAEMVSPLDELRRAAMAQLDLIDRQLGSLPHTIQLGQGGLWPVLDRTMTERHIDLVVVATGGKSNLEHLLVGSSAEEILRKASCPVLTLGPAAGLPTVPAFDVQRIVWAADVASPRAAEWAVALARINQAQLTLLHVVPTGRSSSPTAPRSDASIESALRGLVPDSAGLVAPAEFVIEHGEPAQKILALCHQRQADLLILGCHPGGAFASHSNRAITHQVLSQARCPVLTVH